MKYELIGKTVPTVEITLKNGESIYSQKAGTAWQTEGIVTTTNARGGIIGGLGKIFAKNKVYKNMYTANTGKAKVAFSSTGPCDIVGINIAKHLNGFLIQKSALLCAQPQVDLKVEFNKKVSSGFFGEEGFVLQKAQGAGVVFLEVYGDPVIKKLAPGEVLNVDAGNIVGFEPTVKYEFKKIKTYNDKSLGIDTSLKTKLVGPGKVIIQSQNFNDFAGEILRLLPKN